MPTSLNAPTKRPSEDSIDGRFQFASAASQTKKLKSNTSDVVSPLECLNVETDQTKEYECRFTSALRDARLENLSIPFKNLHKFLEPLTRSLPLLIHHQDQVVHACCQALIIQDADFLGAQVDGPPSTSHLSTQTKEQQVVEIEKEETNRALQAQKPVNLKATSVLDLFVPLISDLSTSLLTPFKLIEKSNGCPLDELLLTLLYFINVSDVEPSSKASEAINHLFKMLAKDLSAAYSEVNRSNDLIQKLDQIWQLVRKLLRANDDNCSRNQQDAQFTINKLFAKQDRHLPLLHLFQLASTLHQLHWGFFDDIVLPRLLDIVWEQLTDSALSSLTVFTASLLADLLSSRNPNFFEKLFDLISIRIDKSISTVLHHLSPLHPPSNYSYDAHHEPTDMQLQECYDWISLCEVLPMERIKINHNQIQEWYSNVLFLVSSMGSEGLRERYLLDYASGMVINRTLLLASIFNVSRRICFGEEAQLSSIVLQQLPFIINNWGWHLSILKFARDICRDVQNKKSMMFDAMYQALKPLLLSERNSIRLLTLEILVEIIIPDSPLDPLLKQCLQIEHTPSLGENIEKRQVHIQQLSIMVNSSWNLDLRWSTILVDIAQRFLIAQLKLTPQQLCQESIQALTKLHKDHHRNLWILVWNQIKMCLDDIPELYCSPRVPTTAILETDQYNSSLPNLTGQPESICTRFKKLVGLLTSYLKNRTALVACDNQYVEVSSMNITRYGANLMNLLASSHLVTKRDRKLGVVVKRAVQGLQHLLHNNPTKSKVTQFLKPYLTTVLPDLVQQLLKVPISSCTTLQHAKLISTIGPHVIEPAHREKLHQLITFLLSNVGVTPFCGAQLKLLVAQFSSSGSAQTSQVPPPHARIVLTRACAEKYGLATPPPIPSSKLLPLAISEILSRPCTYMRQQEEPRIPTSKFISFHHAKGQTQRKRREVKLAEICGVAHMAAHRPKKQPNPLIRYFTKSSVCWSSCGQKLVAVVKFHPFESMDPLTKERYQHLSQHLISQSRYQDPIKINGARWSGKMFSLGWRRGYEKESQIGVPGITKKVARDPEGYEDLQAEVLEVDDFLGERFQEISKPMFQQVKYQHNSLKGPGLAPYFESDEDTFTSHVSFTFDNFSNLPHKDNDSSPFTFVMWIPINHTNGKIIEKNLQIKGGQFVFPDHGFGINFDGFNGIVECVWKATENTHCTLPPESLSLVPHSRLGLSCQLPGRTQLALESIQKGTYDAGQPRAHWTIRDGSKLVNDADKLRKESTSKNK